MELGKGKHKNFGWCFSSAKQVQFLRKLEAQALSAASGILDSLIQLHGTHHFL